MAADNKVNCRIKVEDRPPSDPPPAGLSPRSNGKFFGDTEGAVV
jgi:hypothetical protein